MEKQSETTPKNTQFNTNRQKSSKMTALHRFLFSYDLTNPYTTPNLNSRGTLRFAHHEREELQHEKLMKSKKKSNHGPSRMVPSGNTQPDNR